MFKSLWKRSLLSLRRKPARTIILALVFFVMANLVLTSIAIKSSVAQSMAYAKSSLGGTVSLGADMDKLRGQMKSQTSTSTGGKPDFSKMTRPSVKVQTADKIAAYSDYVKDYSYSVSAGAGSNGISTVASQSQNSDGASGGFGGREMRARNDSTATLSSDFQIDGVSSYAYIPGVQAKTLTLKSCKNNDDNNCYFDSSDDDQVLISYDLATQDNLKIGSTLTLKNIYDSSAVKLTVLGIYDSSDSAANDNAIYANTDTAAKFLSSTDYNNGNYDVDDVKFYLLDSDKADEFISKIGADFPSLASDNLKLEKDTGQYDAMVQPIEAVGGFATTILWIVIAAGVVIITLMTAINVKDRRYEMGVLLSLGASKKNVLGQILVELLLIGTLAFGISAGTGSFVAKALGSGLLSREVSMSRQQSQNNFGRPTGMPGQGGMGGGNFAGGSSAAVPGDNGGSTSAKISARKSAGANTIKTIDVSASPTDFLLLFGVGYVVIILSLIIPAAGVLRYQPKTILAGKE